MTAENGIVLALLKPLTSACFGVLTLLTPLAAWSVEFPPKTDADLIGHSVCDLPEESWLGRFRVPVRGRPTQAIEYRVFGKYHAVNILTAPLDSMKQLATASK